MMGGSLSHEFMYLTPIGEDTILLCEACDYKANRQTAVFQKTKAVAEEMQPIEKVATPDCKTIADLAQFLNIPEAKTAKAVFLTATVMDGPEKRERLVFAIVRGDMNLGITRTLACLAESHRDEYGLVWPASIAPYQVHLVVLRGGEETADSLYDRLREAGIEVLYDDRNEAPGVKFNDADLIGLPLRLTVSKRSLKNGGVEAKLRRETERQIVPLTGAVAYAQNQIQALLAGS